MEEKVLKKFSTTWPFPLLIYKTKITYDEVQKASGIAYILLELIQKSVNKYDSIERVLLGFGIPKELHYLFGNELESLFATGIIDAQFQSGILSQPKFLSQIKLGEISLTEKGRIMFVEGAIPTGVEKAKSKDIFFSPVTRKFDVESKLNYSNLSDSFLGDEFMDRVEIDLSGMEDWLRVNPTKIGIKAEERIVSFETEEPQKKQTCLEDSLTVVMTNAGIRFEFLSTDEDAFFNRYVTSELATEGLALKEEFKFRTANGTEPFVPAFDLASLGEISAIYLPEEIKKQFSRSCNIVFNRGKFGLRRSDRVIEIDSGLSSAILVRIDKTAEFALLDASGCKIYSPLKVRMPCEKLSGEVDLNLLIERIASDDVFKETVRELFSYALSQPFDSGKSSIVTYCVSVLGDISLYRMYAEEKLKSMSSTDERIALILKMNGAFSSAKEWKQMFSTYAERLFSESAADIRLDNMIYKNTVLSPLKKEMGLSDAEYAARFSQNVMQEEPDLICLAMEAADFSETDILGIVNVTERYMQNILQNEPIHAETKIAVPFKTLSFNLWKLNNMLGIENNAKYTLKDNYNADEFFDAYTTFSASVKSVEKYRSYAKNEYTELDKYISIYDPIHELLSIERTASSHPENITKKYIDDHIARGRYKDAICDLLVKLQFDLRKMLQADDTTQANELIDKAKDQGMIDGKETNMLHKLRICRNRLQHPDKGEVRFDKADIESWRDIVFSIGGNK